MKRNIPNINKPEHFDKVFSDKGFKINYRTKSRFEKLLSRYNGGKILNAACGLSPLNEMVSESSEIYAMDCSPKLIENLKEKYPQVNYAVEDIYKMTYPDNEFDYIIAGEVLEHLEEPEKAIKELARVLKPGGTLAVSVPSPRRAVTSAKTEHLWIFQIEDIDNLIKPYGETLTEMFIEDGGRDYIVSFLTKSNGK